MDQQASSHRPAGNETIVAAVYNKNKYAITRRNIVFLPYCAHGKTLESHWSRLLNLSPMEITERKEKWKSTSELLKLDVGIRALRVIDFVQCFNTQSVHSVYVICELVSKDDLQKHGVITQHEAIEIMTKIDDNALLQFNTDMAQIDNPHPNPIKIFLQDHAPYIPDKDNMKLIAVQQWSLMTMQESPLKMTMKQYEEQRRYNQRIKQCSTRRRYDQAQDQALFLNMNANERQNYSQQHEVDSMEVEPIFGSTYFRQHESGPVEYLVRSPYDLLPGLPDLSTDTATVTATVTSGL